MFARLEQTVRNHAARLRVTLSELVAAILEYALCGTYTFSKLPDAQEFLGTKLDVRLADELISKLRSESARLHVSTSVYIRRILYAYYSNRLVLVEKDGRTR